MDDKEKNEQISSLTRELELSREQYRRLIDLHGQLQEQNSVLEERILSIVEKYSNEKSRFEQDLLDAKQQIEQLTEKVKELDIDKQRYKNDCNLAVRLLHQHPKEFLSTPLEQSINSTNPSTHNVIIPTFPPTFATSLTLVNTTDSLPAGTIPTPTTLNNNLHLAKSLFKSDTVHSYPFTYFICSNCKQTIEYSDVGIQTSPENPTVGSFTNSTNGFNGNKRSISLEPHSHSHMTVKEYQRGSSRWTSYDTELPSNVIPQMHHV